MTNKDRMIQRSLLIILLAAGLTACKSASGVRIASTPYADGSRHTEPVNYNGKRYQVSFRYMPQNRNYLVEVAGKGRNLGARPGDRAIVEQVASSTVRHFACPNGQKATIVPGTAHHDRGKWRMNARCG